DWNNLSTTTRPILFQRVRDEIEEHRKKGEVILLYSDLEDQLRQENPGQFDPADVDTVVRQLALQGVLVDSRITSGQRVLVLQIGEIERYAGSLIIAARNNPRGVPAIEEQAVATAKMPLPGIPVDKRLHPFQERIVLECVVQLLLEHGVCLKHEGLLIFPTLFPTAAARDGTQLGHSVSLYYDFSGAIDNIYSSLIVRLTLSERFGRVRLWGDSAEFEKTGQGICGLRKVGDRRGIAHLDLFFGTETPNDQRDLFIVFIEDHLRKEGVSIVEGLQLTCTCSFSFNESSLRKRIADGFNDIICPECEIRSPMREGVEKTRASHPEVEAELFALRTRIEQKGEQTVREVKQAFAEAQPQRPEEESIRILHLSDIHLGASDDPVARLQPLLADLQDKEDGFGFERLDYLVISGDL